MCLNAKMMNILIKLNKNVKIVILNVDNAIIKQQNVNSVLIKLDLNSRRIMNHILIQRIAFLDVRMGNIHL